MSENREAFLERWSRLKTKEREAAAEAEPKPAVPPPAKAEEPAQPLPKIEDLTPQSDFRPFMNASVDPLTRREALKKLFADAHFNVPDPFEAYSGDHTGGEPIPPEMLKTLNQAKKLLFDEPEKTAQAEPAQPQAEEAQTQAEEAQTLAGEAKDGAGRADA
jgi:hypothetical protein